MPFVVSNHIDVNSIFYTIQGEGPFSGMPAVFVRTAGCNLACHFCDTAFEHVEASMSAKDIVNRVETLWPLHSVSRKLMVLTGGEPVRQSACGLLVDEAVERGWTIQVETAGTYWRDWLEKTLIVISPKTSHVHSEFYIHTRMHPGAVHWKYVLRGGEVDEKDGLPSTFTQFTAPEKTSEANRMVILEKYGRPARPPVGASVWVSPCDEGGDSNNIRTVINYEAVARSSLRFGYRAMVQLHKILNLP